MHRLVLIFFIFLNLNAKDFTCNEELKAYLQKNMQDQFVFYKNCLTKELILDEHYYKVLLCKSDKECSQKEGSDPYHPIVFNIKKVREKQIDFKLLATNFKISENTKTIDISDMVDTKRDKESVKIYVFDKNTNMQQALYTACFFDENCYNLTDMDRKFHLIQKIKSNLGNFEFDSTKLPKKAKNTSLEEVIKDIPSGEIKVKLNSLTKNKKASKLSIADRISMKITYKYYRDSMDYSYYIEAFNLEDQIYLIYVSFKSINHFLGYRLPSIYENSF